MKREPYTAARKSVAKMHQCFPIIGCWMTSKYLYQLYRSLSYSNILYFAGLFILCSDSEYSYVRCLIINQIAQFLQSPTSKIFPCYFCSHLIGSKQMVSVIRVMCLGQTVLNRLDLPISIVHPLVQLVKVTMEILKVALHGFQFIETFVHFSRHLIKEKEE